MVFKVVTGYYNEKENKIIPCKMLAVQHTEGDNRNFIPACEYWPLQHGYVENNTFYPTWCYSKDKANWLVSTIYEKSYYVPGKSVQRLPRENEELLNISLGSVGSNGKFHDFAEHGTIRFMARYAVDRYVVFGLTWTGHMSRVAELDENNEGAPS